MIILYYIPINSKYKEGEFVDGSIDLDIDIDLLDLDAATRIMKMTYSFESWHNLLKISDTFFRKASYIYDNFSNNKPIESNYQRPLVYYYGYGLLMKGLANKELENYDEARTCIKAYSNLCWFKGLDDEGLNEVEYYKYISEPNNYEVELLSGNLDLIDRYISFLLKNPKETRPGLITLLKVATKFNLNIESQLNQFSNNISIIENMSSNEIIMASYQQTLFYNMIKYKITIHDHNVAIEYCIKLLNSSDITNSDKIFKKAIVLFESLRQYADPIQIISFELQINSIKERVESL